MHERAELLEASDREVFLTQVPTNRAITAAWDSLQLSTTI